MLLLDQGYYCGVHRGEAAVVGVKGGVEGGGVGERVGGWEGADKETNTGGGEGLGGSNVQITAQVGLVSYSGGRGFSKKPLTAPKSNPLKVC